MSAFSSDSWDPIGAWNNQRLASELGLPFRDARPDGARRDASGVGRAQLIGAMRMKDSAVILGSVAPTDTAAKYSLSWMTQGMIADMIGATTTMLLSDREMPGQRPAPKDDDIRPDKKPMPGEHIDVQG